MISLDPVETFLDNTDTILTRAISGHSFAHDCVVEFDLRVLHPAV